MPAFAALMNACLLLQQSLALPTSPAPTVTPAIQVRPVAYMRRVQTPASELMYRREAARAQQRIARIEARRWRGQSALRPQVRPTFSIVGPAGGFQPWEWSAIQISLGGAAW